MSWLCPYCGAIKNSEGGYSPACCGEVHCIDLGSNEWTDEQLEQIFETRELPKETDNGTAV